MDRNRTHFSELKKEFDVLVSQTFNRVGFEFPIEYNVEIMQADVKKRYKVDNIGDSIHISMSVCSGKEETLLIPYAGVVSKFSIAKDPLAWKSLVYQSFNSVYNRCLRKATPPGSIWQIKKKVKPTLFELTKNVINKDSLSETDDLQIKAISGDVPKYGSKNKSKDKYCKPGELSQITRILLLNKNWFTRLK